MLVICGGHLVIRKTMVWAMQMIGRGLVNDVFENGRFKGNLYWKYREMAKIRHFVDLNPLTGLFYANFKA